MARLVVQYPKPKEPAHFDRYFRETHVALVKKMPGLRGTSLGPATEPEGEGAFFRGFVGTWDSVDATKAAVGTPERQAAVADIPNSAIGGSPTILFFDSTDA